jgi:microsomal epoxide hydrolase
MHETLFGGAMIAIVVFLVLILAPPCSASPRETEHFFKTSDRVSLHYKNVGRGDRALVFVPGWLMPGEVFRPQWADLGDDYRVVVLDPRGQGRSQVKVKDMSAARRARDIHELLRHLKLTDYVLIGWSLGVMEVLEAATHHPLDGLRALVLIDNSIGMGPAPAAAVAAPSGASNRPMGRGPFGRYVSEFSRAIFKRPPADDLLKAVERSARQLPPAVAWRLLDKPHPRSYYKAAVLARDLPLWYAITPRYSAQAQELLHTRPQATVTVFDDAGHALFVDSAEAFNAGLRQFLLQVP